MGTPGDHTDTDDVSRYIFGRLRAGIYRAVVPAFGDYARAEQQIELSGNENSIIIRRVSLYVGLKRISSAKAPNWY